MKKIIVALLCALFLVACGGVQSSPEKAAVEFVAKMYKGDAESVMKLLDLGDIEKEPGMKQMWEGKIAAGAAESKQHAESKGGIKEIKVATKDIKEDKAVIRPEVVFKDGSTESNGDLSLVKKNGKWWVLLK